MFNRMVGQAFTGVAKGAGKALMNPVSGYAAFGVGLAGLTHDPAERSLSDHMMRETTKTMGDLPADLALFGAGSAAGAWGAVRMGAAAGGKVAGIAGMVAGIGLSIGMYATGLNPGAAIQKSFEKADKEYSKRRNDGLAPITKNKRTMGAMQQGLNLLGQSRAGSRGMLGSEAQYMHN